jgi:predicted O-methyltransferase YrrM
MSYIIEPPEFEKLWLEAEKITGYLFSEEGKCLYECSSQVPENGVIVELGSFCGKSSRIIADVARSRKAKLYCVDAFIPHFDGVPTKAEDALKEFTEKVLTPFYDQVELIKKDTAVAAEYFKQDIDFLFIDADHSYGGVVRDCTAWLPKLKSGSLVAFHDYNSESWGDVKRAAQLFVSGWHNIRNDYSIAVFRKP